MPMMLMASKDTAGALKRIAGELGSSEVNLQNNQVSEDSVVGDSGY